jgi:cellulose synthase/poly-beta-1,6-N-acetylglucosamine synthase-like glycosyltransferase
MLLGPWQAIAIGLYAVAQVLLVVYSSHRYVVLWRLWRHRRQAIHAPVAERCEWPRVTVQLPVFNERLVVERLIDAAAGFDYPRDCLEIQVLDDSTDDTRAIAARAVAAHRARGVDIVHLPRAERRGYKAGALAAGLDRARGELIAVLDADFVPRPDFLRRLAPHFADPRVGMVQARWGHLNRDRSLLTRAQAVMLDAHFLVEHEARQRSGLFFNFNGTAGLWRRRCIDEAGGWSHDTLTEDLDLSYRAQLAGWRFVFDAAVEVPAELPRELDAFKSQQRRWAKGSIQTARKLLPRVWASGLPGRLGVEAFFHLTSNAAYPLLLGLALLLLPVLLGASSLPPLLLALVQAGVLAFGVLPVVVFLAAGQFAAGRPREAPLTVAAALVLGVGLSLNNARAVVEGLSGPTGDWERTPKTGDGHARAAGAGYTPARPRSGGGELALAAWFVAVATVAVAADHMRAIPFLALLTTGFGLVGLGSLRLGAPARVAGGPRARRSARAG